MPFDPDDPRFSRPEFWRGKAAEPSHNEPRESYRQWLVGQAVAGLCASCSTLVLSNPEGFSVHLAKTAEAIADAVCRAEKAREDELVESFRKEARGDASNEP
jgi:hypothetical protein